MRERERGSCQKDLETRPKPANLTRPLFLFITTLSLKGGVDQKPLSHWLFFRRYLHQKTTKKQPIEVVKNRRITASICRNLAGFQPSHQFAAGQLLRCSQLSS